MYCYQCGIELSEQAKFCSGCGRSTAPAPPKKNMEMHVQVVAWLFICSAVLYGMLGIALLIAPRILEMIPIPIPPDVPFDVIHFVSAVAGILGAAILIVCAGTAAAGVGLLQYQTWGRTLALVMAAVMLLKVPFGTFIGIYAFWVLLSRPGREYYEHKSALAEGRAG